MNDQHLAALRLRVTALEHVTRWLEPLGTSTPEHRRDLLADHAEAFHSILRSLAEAYDAAVDGVRFEPDPEREAMAARGLSLPPGTYPVGQITRFWADLLDTTVTGTAQQLKQSHTMEDSR